jgi:hypothetical protein
VRTRSEARNGGGKRFEKDDAPEWQIEVPSDPINEQVLLAAMIIDPATRARLVKLPADAFYAAPHRAIFVGLQELTRRKLEYDAATVARLAPEADVRVLEVLEASRPELPPNLDFHVQTLEWDHHRATATKGPLAKLIEAVQDPKQAPDHVRALARAVGESFDRVEGSGSFLRKPAEVVREMMVRLRARVEGEALYPFGIVGLDTWEDGATNAKGEDLGGTARIVPGAAPGLATMLTGMSGAGKTTIAGHAIIGIARQRRKVLVGAWEVRAPMTLELLTVLSLGWSRVRLLNGKSNRLGAGLPMTHDELVFFEERAHKISKRVTFVENPFRRGSVKTTGRVTNDDYLDILEEHIELSGCDVAVFDLFDRVLRERRPNDEQEALWRMLEFTERLQIHSMIVHQQLLKGEGVRRDMKPSIQGLKGSSAYVDAASLILAPHLPARWKNVPDDTMEVYALKQRFGPPFGVEFDWDPDTGQIKGGRAIEASDARDGDSAEAEAFGIPRTRKRKMKS